MAVAARASATLVLALASAVAPAGCGGSAGDDTTTAERLAQPGSTWADLSPAQQRDAIGLCRLDAAAVAAQPSGSPPVARNGAFAQVLQVHTGRIRRQLDRRFADAAGARERVADGCRAVLREDLDAAGAAVAPALDFGPPMRLTEHGPRLTVQGDAVTIPVRTRDGAPVRVVPTPGRARTTARIAVRQDGDTATIRLTRVPRGTSYLRAISDGIKTDIVVRGTAARRLPEPRTFPPMRIHGDGSRRLVQFYLPQDGRATISTQGAPLTVTAGETVLLAHSTATAHPQPQTIPAGRYDDVRVRTSGPWSIRIVPAREP